MKYAQNTQVSSERSKIEIERTLTRYGAKAFIYGWEEDRAVIMFRMYERQIKFEIPMPDKKSPDICQTPTGKKRTAAQIEAEFGRSVRQKWRALLLIIKAKLEAVVSGVCIFEEEFLAHIVLPTGATIGQFMIPQIEQIYQSGAMPKLLSIGKKK